MGMAPVAHVLFNKFMTFNPKNPGWANRDRFVLSYVHPTASRDCDWDTQENSDDGVLIGLL